MRDYPCKPDDCCHEDIDWKMRDRKPLEPLYDYIQDVFGFGGDIISVDAECCDCGKKAKLYYKLVRFGEEQF